MTEDCRTYTVEAESRTYTVDTTSGGVAGTGWHDDYILTRQYFGAYYMPLYYFPVLYATGAPTQRKYTVEAESRTKAIAAENRTLAIEAENRTLTVEC